MLAVAYLIGRPTLKLKGHYLAMGTLGFGVIVFIVFNEAYGYFRQDWFSRMLVRFALKTRLHVRLLELRARADKLVAKGPVAVYERDVPPALQLRNSDTPGHAPSSYEAPADIFQ